MKPIAVFIVVAALAVSTAAAGAKTVNTSQGNANDQTVAGLAGSGTAAANSHKTPDVMPMHKKIAHKVRHKAKATVQKD